MARIRVTTGRISPPLVARTDCIKYNIIHFVQLQNDDPMGEKNVLVTFYGDSLIGDMFDSLVKTNISRN